MEDSLKIKLTELGLIEEQVGKLEAEGAKDEADVSLLSADDIKNATGCGIVTARKVAAEFAPAPEVAPTMFTADAFGTILPTVPDDESWLKALRTGGVLKVEQSTVISAVRAALAQKAGLYQVPDLLVKAMEAYTDETEEQAGPEFFKLRKMLTQSQYGDLFAAIDGMDGNFVTKARRAELLDRIDQLWPTVISFNEQLKNWQQAWTSGGANPMLMMAMAMGKGGTMPPGLMSPPDTAGLRDAAETVNDQINRIFRGTGVQITAALAWDANRIKEVLNQDNLHATVGAPNREQMLKKLGINVSANYPRLETNLTQFILGIMKASDQPAGEEELRYWSALYVLGTQLDLSQIGARGHTVRAGIGRLSADD